MIECRPKAPRHAVWEKMNSLSWMDGPAFCLELFGIESLESASARGNVDKRHFKAKKVMRLHERFMAEECLMTDRT